MVDYPIVYETPLGATCPTLAALGRSLTPPYTEGMSRPTILVISLSDIASDARVLRQIGVAAEVGHVTTIGYGPHPTGADEHIQVPSDKLSLPQTPSGVLKLALRRFRSAELDAPGVRFILDALKERTFDAVIANEARILACAHRVAKGAPVWADLHEYAPEERTHIRSWRLLVAPLMDYMCREYLPKATAATTVAHGIAELYEESYGVRPELMRNAAPLQNLSPTELEGDRIRLVHSGGAVHGRNLEAMIDAVRQLPEQFTLDMYLIAASDGGGYLRSLEQRAAGDPRITIHDAVSPQELPRVLNQYDVGVFWMPPTHTNGRLALPNKLFDYVQARLALAIGPSIEMVRIVQDHDLGVISESFDVEDIVASLRTLTPESVAAFKQSSDAAAPALSFDNEAEVERAILRRMLNA